jgi:hypothetical protein
VKRVSQFLENHTIISIKDERHGRHPSLYCQP